MGNKGASSGKSGGGIKSTLPEFETVENKLLNGSKDVLKGKSPLKQLSESEFEEVKNLDIPTTGLEDKTISIDSLYSTQPENSMRRLETVYDHFKNDPEALYNNIVRPNEFMQAKPNLPIRVVKYKGKNIITDGNHRIVILKTLGQKSVKVKYINMDK